MSETPKISRSLFLFGALSTAIVGCAPNRSAEPRKPETSSLEGYPLVANEPGTVIKYGDTMKIDNSLSISNYSQVDLTVAMSRISAEIGTEAGLIQPQLSLKANFTDKPDTSNTTGGVTAFDPNTGDAVSEVSIPYYMARVTEQTRLPNTVLTTVGRRNGYLSVLLSQALLVELSNQAHIRGHLGRDFNTSKGDQIDKNSNLLGVKYVRQIVAGQAKPFIIVNSIK